RTVPQDSLHDHHRRHGRDSRIIPWRRLHHPAADRPELRRSRIVAAVQCRVAPRGDAVRLAHRGVPFVRAAWTGQDVAHHEAQASDLALSQMNTGPTGHLSFRGWLVSTPKEAFS